MYKISVIVPSFCPGEYVRDNIRSLSSQSLDHSLFEVLFVINGTREPYESFLEDLLSQTDLHYRILFSSQTGVSHARNIGLDLAEGEYVTFIDDDDWVSEGFLESLLKVSSGTEVGVSSFKAYMDDPLKEETSFFLCRRMRRPEWYLSLPFYKCRSVLSVSVGKLTHRDIIGKRRFDERFGLGEDSLFYTSLTDRIHRLRYAGDEAVYSVLLRNDSATHKRYSVWYILSNALRLIGAYFKVFLTNPSNYSIRLFLMRIPGIAMFSATLLSSRSRCR